MPRPGLGAAAYWPVAALAEAPRTGIAPGARTRNDWMPSARLRCLTDEEMVSRYACLQTLKAPVSTP